MMKIISNEVKNFMKLTTLEITFEDGYVLKGTIDSSESIYLGRGPLELSSSEELKDTAQEMLHLSYLLVSINDNIRSCFLSYFDPDSHEGYLIEDLTLADIEQLVIK